MPKIEIHRWCDYVRGLSSPAEAAELEAYLERASATERRTVSLLSRFEAVAQEDRSTEVPAHALRGVKAIASLARKPEVPQSRFRFLPFDILFDSGLTPALAGIRSSDGASALRHLSIETPPWSLDLQVDAQQTDARAVIGQLTTLTEKDMAPAGDVPVLARVDRRVVRSTITDTMGEFQLGDLPSGALDVCLIVGTDTGFEVPLGT